MFQNIVKDFEEQNPYEDVEIKNSKIKEILKKSFSKQMIILYIISFLMSLVSFQINKELAPFGIAILIAILSNCMPIGITSIVVIIGTAISNGGGGTLNLLLSLLLIFFSILLRSPKYDESANEKRKLGTRVFFCTLIVQLMQVLFKDFILLNDLDTVSDTWNYCFEKTKNNEKIMLKENR